MMPDCVEPSGFSSSYDRDATIHRVFATVAEAQPDAPAICDEFGVISYAALDTLTNRIARRMIERGVRPGTVVGFLTIRSRDAVIGWLAALKCGAAYMPLDPTYPVAALDYMVRDAAPALVLAQRDHFDTNRALAGRSVLILEEEWSAAHTYDGAPLPDRGTALDPAYVMYTSGSTGKPKGVLVPHRGVVRLVRQQTLANLTPNDCILFTAALTFDVAARDVWGALLNGGRLAIVSGTQLSLDQIAEAIAQHGVTAIHTTAALFHLFVDHRLEALRPLKTLVVGGDVMSPAKAMTAVEALPNLCLINAYGPTENSTISTWYQVSREGWGDGPVPIGKPIAHSTAYILDDDLQPVPIGVPGMLWTGGDGVALGYLNRSELTNERFRPDPFDSDPNARMYNSGDLAQWRTDSNIEFIGRKDRQVKISGKRIELDEVEHEIRSDLAVMDAAVALQSRDGDDKRIVAFVKLNVDHREQGAHGKLMARLRSTMPAHMLPAELHIVDDFPVTPHGKIDRKSLLESRSTAASWRTATASIEDDLEKRIAQIWCDVLKLSSIGRSENFFDLGGKSLHLIQVHALLRQSIAPTLDVVDLFRRPTVADLAAHLREGGSLKTSSDDARSRASRQRSAMEHARARRQTTNK
jgi:amino acid adenylation domain-containing protein